MKIQGKSQDLVELLSKVATVCSSSKDNPILGGVLLTVTKKEIMAVATDGERFIKAELTVNAAISIEEGSVVIQKGLIEFLRKTSDFELSLESSALLFKGKRTKLEFPILDPSDFPKLPDTKQKEKSFSLEHSQLTNIYNKTSLCVSEKDQRPILTGINIKGSVDKLSFTGTDSHQFCRIDVEQALKEDINVTVPSKSVKDIVNTFKGEISFFCVENLFIAKDDNTTYYARIIVDTKYPETDMFVEVIMTNKIILSVNRKETIHALKNVEYLLKEENKMKDAVKCELIGDDVLQFSATPGKSSISLEVPVSEVQGEGNVEFYFSIKLLLNLLSTMEGEDAQIGFDEELTPIAVLPEELCGEYRMFSPVRAK